VVLDERFAKYKLGNSPIRRLYHSKQMLWAEGPAWNGVGRYLLWSDIPNNVQLRYMEDDGHVSTRFRFPSGNSNGNTFDFQGRQISCEHGNRRVVRYEYNGKMTVLAQTFDGKPFNAPNDAVVHPNGDIWFTDPGYGSMMNYEGNKGTLHLKESVYRIDGKTGKIVKVTDEIDKPNGLCFSPDEKTLYINDSGLAHIRAFDVNADGSLSNGRMFKDNIGDGSLEGGIPDGMKCDERGNVYVTGPKGIWIITPEGEHLGTIETPEHAGNHNWGGADWKDLYCCCTSSLYRIRLNVAGNKLSYMG